MVFACPCKFGLLQTIYPMASWRRNESREKLGHSGSVSTRSEQKSDQLCSKQAEGRALMQLDCSGNTEASKDWNLGYVQDRTEGNRGPKFGGYDRDGQWRHCDSKGCES